MKEKIVFDPANAAETDNIGAYVTASDGTLITHHTVSGYQGLDVYVLNPSLEVTQGTSPWIIGDGGNSISIDDNGGSITVDAVNLDIRDLSYTQDSIAIFGATGNQLAVNADGSINVNADISVVSGHEKAEDAASANGDIGSYVLSVRQDILASSTSTDGDFQSFKTDSVGALWVRMSQSTPPSVDNQIDNAALSVTTTAAIIATAVAGRRKMIIQNVDNSKPFYIGKTGVTVGTGLRLSPGAVIEIELDGGTDLYAISALAGGVAGRLLETGYV